MLSYIILLVLTRIMGKRELSQLTYFDYIVGITIDSITAIMAVDTSEKWYYALWGLIVFSLLQVISALIALRSVRFRETVDGKSTMLIKDGKLIEKNMKKERLNVSELASKLRKKTFS